MIKIKLSIFIFICDKGTVWQKLGGDVKSVERHSAAAPKLIFVVEWVLP